MFSDFEKGSKPNLPPCRWTWGCNKWALWVSLVGISIFLSVSQFGTAAFLVNAGCKRGEQEQRNCRIRLHLTNGCPGRGFMSPPSQSRWSHCLTVTQSGALVTALWKKNGGMRTKSVKEPTVGTLTSSVPWMHRFLLPVRHSHTC